MRDTASPAVGGGNCAACRFNLPDGARFCPRCGVAIGTEFLSVTASRPDGPREGRTGRRPPALAVMATVGVLLVGGLAVADRATRPEPAPEPTTSTSTSTSTTTSTTAPASTSTTAAEARTLPRQPLPQLPGLHLEVLLSDGSITEIDMATGAAHTFRIDRVYADQGTIAVVDGGMVVSLSNRLYALPEGTDEVRKLEETSGMIVAEGARYALVATEGGPVPQRFFLADAAGTAAVVAKLDAYQIFQAVWGSRLTADDRVVISRGERIGLMDPATGEIAEIDEGQVLAAGPNHVLRRSCDTSGSCRDEVLALSGAAEPVETAIASQGFGRNELSPDGQWLTGLQFHDSGPPTARAVNLRTGAEISFAAEQGPPMGDDVGAFSPDSRFYVTWSEEGVQLWDLSTGAVVGKLTDLGARVLSVRFSTRASGR